MYERTENIRFSVTAEMKEGLILLFKGRRYSDVFEDMVFMYLQNQKDKYAPKYVVDPKSKEINTIENLCFPKGFDIKQEAV